MAFLTPQKYFIVPDQGWSGWDLKIARGLWSRAFVLVCAENHGGVKRLLRVKCAMRLSRLSAFVMRSYAVAAAVALIADVPVAASVIGVVGVAHFGLIAYQTWVFGGLMHGIIDAVALQARLKPIEAATRQPVAIGSPRIA